MTKDHSDSEIGNVGKVLTCATAIAFTAAFYWLYIQLYLIVGQVFQDGPDEQRFNMTGSGITIGLAFNLVALGLLWRYLTPMRVCRFWQQCAEEISSPYVQAWKRGHRLIPALAISVIVGIFVLPPAAVVVIGNHIHKPGPAHPIGTHFAAPPPNYELPQLIPCDQATASRQEATESNEPEFTKGRSASLGPACVP